MPQEIIGLPLDPQDSAGNSKMNAAEREVVAKRFRALKGATATENPAAETQGTDDEKAHPAD